MDDALACLFLGFSVSKLRQLAERIEDCLRRLSDQQVWQRGGENQNAVGNLVLHLCGNLRQWIGHGAGALPDIRRRDAEFAARGGLSRAELSRHLASGVREAVAVLEQVGPGRLAQQVVIQGYQVTVLEAIYHAVEHFAQHTGQIIFFTKLVTGEDLGYYRHLNGAAPRTDPQP